MAGKISAMPEVPRRRRGQGIVTRQGAVKQARQEAGLTLHQLSGGVVSRQAIHLIEQGKARPSLSVLQHIAQATAKPISFFVEGSPAETLGSRIAEIERLFVCREFESAVRLGEEVLADGPMARLADEAEASLWLGAALAATSRPDRALVHLSKARSLFRQLGDLWRHVEAMDWEACALHLKEDPSALPMAERALAECRQLDPVPAATASRILGHIGAMYVSRRAWRQALKGYEDALEAAGSLRDLRQSALMNHNLAIVYQRTGMPGQAMVAAQRALALYSLDADRVALARLENDLGDMLLKQGHLDLAAGHLNNAVSSFHELGIEARGPNYSLLGLAEIAIARTRPDEAQRLLDEALAGGERLGEALVVACAHQLRGRLAANLDNHVQSDAEYGSAIEALRDLSQPDRLSDCHAEYADVLTKRGLLADAIPHLKEAARLARGLPSEAEEAEETSASAS